MRTLQGLLLFAAFVAIAPWLKAGDGHVRVKVLAETPAVTPGNSFWVGFKLTMDPGWHTYYKDPGDSGMPTKIEWDLPEGFRAGEIQWPAPRRIETPPLVSLGYEGEAVLLQEITPPASLRASNVTLRAKVTWLECKEECIPGFADLSLTLPVSPAPREPNAQAKGFFARARAGLKSNLHMAVPPKPQPLAGGWAVLLAFLGGVLLNLMPCVLPVLSIKALSFIHTPRPTLKRHGLFYTAGVIVSLSALAGILILYRAGGEKIGWGFQLQSPSFVGLLTLVFFALGLNLMGVFEIGTSLVGWGGVRGNPSDRNAFLSGALAVLVATPCTAPFMGPAIGYALTQPAPAAMSIFVSLGLGLAAPYLLLSYFPGGLKWIPKPGPWMETFKQSLSFLFFGTVVWLLWVLGIQSGCGFVVTILGLCVGMALGAWLLGPVASRLKTDFSRQWVARTGMLIMFLSAMSVFSLEAAKGTSNERQTYSPERVESLLREGRPVFVDFTAAWCITCQVNRKTALDRPEVKEAFERTGVTFLIADWTNRDPVISETLEHFGRNGVPFYVLFVPGNEPTILPTLLTPRIVIDALETTVKRSDS